MKTRVATSLKIWICLFFFRCKLNSFVGIFGGKKAQRSCVQFHQQITCSFCANFLHQKITNPNSKRRKAAQKHFHTKYLLVNWWWNSHLVEKKSIEIKNVPDFRFFISRLTCQKYKLGFVSNYLCSLQSRRKVRFNNEKYHLSILAFSLKIYKKKVIYKTIWWCC